ncbi:MAG: LacI family DNA-binding transcriptional regulator [Beijerinckiaceae bacterium]
MSLATVADAAGVSVATVSRIANGQTDRANGRTVARVRSLLDEMGYRPNSVGQSLRKRQSRIVALLAANLNNPAMAAIASSTEAALRAQGYVMIMGDTHDEPALQDEYLEAMHAQFVQGYILVSAVASAGLSRFIARHEPIVLVGRRPAGIAPATPFVGIDNHAAGMAAADYLLHAGVHDPGIVHTALSSSAITDRVAGFMQHYAKNGFSIPAHSVVSSHQLQHLAAGYEAAQTLVTQRGGWPPGLFCASDMLAYGAYRLACETGMRIPGDCVMAGIDDSPLNSWIAPWLTSVHIPYSDFGDAIMAQLSDLWSSHATHDRLLPHRLVTRATPHTTAIRPR